MPKQERTSSSGQPMAVKLKEDPDKDPQRALRLSKQEHGREQMRRLVKEEVPKTGVKSEPHVALKREPQVKKEQPAIKSESTSSSSVKTEQRTDALPSLKTKIEQLRKVKAELKTKMESDTDVADLVRRGLEIRAQAQKKALKGKKRNGVKIKKERSLRLDGRPRRKQRVTAKRRNASREAMNRSLPLSDELAELLGISEASRPEAVRRLWLHCKENNMLNPDNRREVRFDEKLEQILGTSKATMPQFISLLTPHFDYVKAEQIKREVKSEVKTEPAKKMKTESGAKRTCKGEQTVERNELASTKRELATTKREPVLSVASPQKAKLEPMTAGRSVEAQNALEDSLRAVVPRIAKFDRTSGLVQFVAASCCNDLEAVAVPSTGSSCAQQRAPCNMEFRENADGSMALHVESKIEGLNPTVAYQLFFQTRSGAACSREAYLPQRANPAKWAQRDAEVWCASQQVPELLQMVQKYGIDGQTLLSLGEEDLRQSGLVVPFLLRRVLAGLESLRNSRP